MLMKIRIGDVLSAKRRIGKNTIHYEMEVEDFIVEEREVEDSSSTRCLLRFQNVVQKYLDTQLSTEIQGWGYEFEVNKIEFTQTTITYEKVEGQNRQIYPSRQGNQLWALFTTS